MNEENLEITKTNDLREISESIHNSIKMLNKTIVDNKKLDRTFAYIAHWNNFGLYKEIAEIRKIINSYPDEAKQPEIFKRALNQSEELEQKVCTTLNLFEEIGIAVDRDLVDEEILKDFFEYIFYRYATIFKDYIEKERKDKKYDNLYIKFTNLSEKWQQRSR